MFQQSKIYNFLNLVNITSCHKIKEHYELYEDEFKEYDEEIIIFKRIFNDLKQSKTQGNSNLDERKIVNLQKDEYVKNVRIRVH